MWHYMHSSVVIIQIQSGSNLCTGDVSCIGASKISYWYTCTKTYCRFYFNIILIKTEHSVGIIKLQFDIKGHGADNFKAT